MLTREVGLIVLDLRSQTIRCQNYTQNFILFTTVKIPRFHGKIPKSQIDPQILKILGKIPSSASAGFMYFVCAKIVRFCRLIHLLQANMKYVKYLV